MQTVVREYRQQTQVGKVIDGHGLEIIWNGCRIFIAYTVKIKQYNAYMFKLTCYRIFSRCIIQYKIDCKLVKAHELDERKSAAISEADVHNYCDILTQCDDHMHL